MKTKLDERIENAINAFFKNENSNVNDSLISAHNTNLFDEISGESFTKKADGFVKTLKQAFLFFPGTYILFYVTLGTVLFYNYITSQAIPHPGEAKRIFIVYSAAFASIFMTWLGLGNIRNLKHSLIPGSIVLTAVIIGLISQATSGIFSLHEKLTKDFNVAVLLFPLALVIPILAKGWIGRIDKDSN